MINCVHWSFFHTKLMAHPVFKQEGLQFLLQGVTLNRTAQLIRIIQGGSSSSRPPTAPQWQDWPNDVRAESGNWLQGIDTPDNWRNRNTHRTAQTAGLTARWLDSAYILAAAYTWSPVQRPRRSPHRLDSTSLKTVILRDNYFFGLFKRKINKHVPH